MRVKGPENGLWISSLGCHLLRASDLQKSGEVSSSYESRDAETTQNNSFSQTSRAKLCLGEMRNESQDLHTLR